MMSRDALRAWVVSAVVFVATGAHAEESFVVYTPSTEECEGSLIAQCPWRRVFDILAGSCSPAVLRQFAESRNLDVDSYEERTPNFDFVCDISHPLTRHWLADLLVVTSIDSAPETIWSPALDYFPLVQASGTHSHPPIYYRLHDSLVDGKEANAYFNSGSIIDYPYLGGRITLTRNIFEQANPMEFARILVHEAAHAMDNGERKHLSGEACRPINSPYNCDPYFPHVSSHGQLHSGVRVGEKVEHFPAYQVDYEFYCDYSESPAFWWPRTISDLLSHRGITRRFYVADGPEPPVCVWQSAELSDVPTFRPEEVVVTIDSVSSGKVERALVNGGDTTIVPSEAVYRFPAPRFGEIAEYPWVFSWKEGGDCVGGEVWVEGDIELYWEETTPGHERLSISYLLKYFEDSQGCRQNDICYGATNGGVTELGDGTLSTGSCDSAERHMVAFDFSEGRLNPYALPQSPPPALFAWSTGSRGDRLEVKHVYGLEGIQ